MKHTELSLILDRMEMANASAARYEMTIAKQQGQICQLNAANKDLQSQLEDMRCLSLKLQKKVDQGAPVAAPSVREEQLHELLSIVREDLDQLKRWSLGTQPETLLDKILKGLESNGYPNKQLPAVPDNYPSYIKVTP